MKTSVNTEYEDHYHSGKHDNATRDVTLHMLNGKFDTLSIYKAIAGHYQARSLNLSDLAEVISLVEVLTKMIDIVVKEQTQ